MEATEMFNFILNILSSQLAIIIAVAVMIIVQLLKKMMIPARFIPLISFGSGVILTFLLFGFQTIIIIPAIIIGGASSGLYDLGKITILGK